MWGGDSGLSGTKTSMPAEAMASLNSETASLVVLRGDADARREGVTASLSDVFCGLLSAVPHPVVSPITISATTSPRIFISSPIPKSQGLPVSPGESRTEAWGIHEGFRPEERGIAGRADRERSLRQWKAIGEAAPAAGPGSGRSSSGSSSSASPKSRDHHGDSQGPQRCPGRRRRHPNITGLCVLRAGTLCRGRGCRRACPCVWVACLVGPFRGGSRSFLGCVRARRACGRRRCAPGGMSVRCGVCSGLARPVPPPRTGGWSRSPR